MQRKSSQNFEMKIAKFLLKFLHRRKYENFKQQRGNSEEEWNNNHAITYGMCTKINGPDFRAIHKNVGSSFILKRYFKPARKEWATDQWYRDKWLSL